MSVKYHARELYRCLFIYKLPLHDDHTLNENLVESKAAFSPIVNSCSVDGVDIKNFGYEAVNINIID